MRNELHSHERMEASRNPVIKLFLNDCHGVRLVLSGSDGHVCFEILSEDDGYWFIKKSYSASYWFPDMIDALHAAFEWCKSNCESGEYGYKLKPVDIENLPVNHHKS